MQWKQSSYDANFVITGGTGGCLNDNLQCATSNDKVGIMIIHHYHCASD